jgi:DNA-nicking Smr family endonuclease
MEKKRTSSRRSETNAAADATEFRAAVRDVKPLEQVPRAAGLARAKPRARRAMPAHVEALDEMMPLIAFAPDADSQAQDTALSAALSFQRAGVRTQVMRRLRRGQYPVEAELDLHGLNQAAARDRLAEFLAVARDSGRRCVRIIHGKGYRSGARGPVLKTAVDLWLRRHLDVLAFSSARAIDGGTGALYVLLRA